MFKLIDKSGNSKISAPDKPMSATMTVSSSCAPTCPLIDGGCYAKNSFVGMHWRKLDREGGASLEALCVWIKDKASKVWRHNVAGDLPHRLGTISARALRAIVQANSGKRGFTYTHHVLSDDNIAAIEHANANGFTVNVSTNTPGEADEAKRKTSAPVVTLLPSDAPIKGNVTPEGRKITVCPAEYIDGMACAKCELCAIPTRETIIGFRAHGTKKGTVNAISKGE